MPARSPASRQYAPYSAPIRPSGVRWPAPALPGSSALPAVTCVLLLISFLNPKSSLSAQPAAGLRAGLYDPSFLTLTTGRSKMAVPEPAGGAVAEPEPDPLQQALISLVIRGMARGAPDEATAALADQGLAMVKGPIVMPTPEGTAAAAALLRLET